MKLYYHIRNNTTHETVSTRDGNGNFIGSGSHIAHVNPFRYRGYYYDRETGLYYLMSRYYDPQTGRFINSDGIFDTADGILSQNMYAYCQNNPIMFVDPTGECYEPVKTNGGHVLYNKWVICTAIPGVPDFCGCCNTYTPGSEAEAAAFARRGNGESKPRKDPKKGSENRQPTGDRERNKKHPNGEEHSRVPKGNPGIRKSEPVPYTLPEFKFVNPMPSIYDLIDLYKYLFSTNDSNGSINTGDPNKWIWDFFGAGSNY